MSEKMMRKVFKMRSSSQAGKIIPGGVGPLKNRRKQDNQTTKHWTEHALACLAARWRIYIQVGSAQAAALQGTLQRRYL